MKKSYRLLISAILLLSIALALVACKPDVEPVKLTAPDGIEVVGTDLVWNNVENAEGYSVQIDGKTYFSSTNIYNLSDFAADDYYVVVKALSDGAGFKDSDWSTIIVITVGPGQSEAIYSVAFVTSGGGTFAMLELKEGDAINLPTPNKGDNYAFTGWFTDAGCTVPFTLTLMPANNLILYAGWEAIL